MALLLMTSLKLDYYTDITDCNFDIICLSEAFLNSPLNREDDRLKIEGYDLIRSDNPNRLKTEDVCIYYKEHIPLIRRDDPCSLRDCLITEIRLENENCFLTCLHRLPCQHQHEFKIFRTNLVTLMDYINNEIPTCSVLIGDLNARCTKWCNNDITNANGYALDTLTSLAGYKQIMNKSTSYSKQLIFLHRSYILQ